MSKPMIFNRPYEPVGMPTRFTIKPKNDGYVIHRDDDEYAVKMKREPATPEGFGTLRLYEEYIVDLCDIITVLHKKVAVLVESVDNHMESSESLAIVLRSAIHRNNNSDITECYALLVDAGARMDKAMAAYRAIAVKEENINE